MKNVETEVVNVHHQTYDAYIGRNSKPYHFGNPFTIGIDGDRNDIIRKFDLWLSGVAYTYIEPRRREWIIAHLEELRGKRLGCHCKPLACHGDIYVRMLNERRWD